VRIDKTLRDARRRSTYGPAAARLRERAAELQSIGGEYRQPDFATAQGTYYQDAAAWLEHLGLTEEEGMGTAPESGGFWEGAAILASLCSLAGMAGSVALALSDHWTIATYVIGLSVWTMIVAQALWRSEHNEQTGVQS
jgi:hypothetical protein